MEHTEESCVDGRFQTINIYGDWKILAPLADSDITYVSVDNTGIQGD